MNYFSFCGVSCETYGIFVKKTTRILLPKRRLNQIVIGGRDGVYEDETGAAYDSITIKLNCAVCAGSVPELRGRARDIAGWLSRKGELEFADEPGKFYTARVISEIPLENRLMLGEFTLIFQCFPFAMSRPNVAEYEITRTGQSCTVRVSGTAKTPLLLTLKNTGTQPVTGIVFGHRAELN